MIVKSEKKSEQNSNIHPIMPIIRQLPKFEYPRTSYPDILLTKYTDSN